MSKFQKGISFNTVEDCLDFLPEDEKKIVNNLRSIILDCMPHGKEKLAYNVPFYYQNKRVFFIWPASVSWGGTKEKGTVVFGFCKGQFIPDELDYLNKEGRKEIATKKFSSVKEINADLLRTYIYEALLIDEQQSKKKSL